MISNNQTPHMNAAAQLQLALHQHSTGQLDHAEQIYRQILATAPRQQDALHFLGMLLHQRDNNTDALPLLEKSIAVSPRNAVFLNNLATVLIKLNRPEDAVAACQKAISVQPKFGPAFYNRGNALLLVGKPSEALESFRSAFKHGHDTADVHNAIGRLSVSQQNFQAAAISFRRAIKLKPATATSYADLGVALVRVGDLEGAKDAYTQSLALAPDVPDVLNNLANTMFKLDKMTARYMSDPHKMYLHALELCPDFAEAQLNLAFFLAQCGFTNLVTGNAEAAAIEYREALEVRPNFPEAHSNLLLCIQYLDTLTHEEKFQEHIKFAGKFETPVKPFWPTHQNTPDASRRIRVGYVSADFRNHAVASFFEPILKNHDRTKFDIYCYYNHAQQDEMSTHIRSLADAWRPCDRATDNDLFEIITADQIDVLVDLSGHTAANRLPVFAMKPAPVQMTWIGYAGTTGLTAMDYRITDRHLDPPGMTEPFHVEKLARLPTASATFTPSPESPAVNALPALARQVVTFASLNGAAKITTTALETWAKILQSVSNSRMLIGNVNDESLRIKIIGIFKERGVAEDRLDLRRRLTMNEYLSLHHEIDICLDSFPYAGGTTTCHALWMGVPVVTLAGNHPITRCGVALLSPLGLSDYIAENNSEYISIASDMANDLNKLSTLRSTLRNKMENSTLMKPIELVGGLETIYRDVWTKWCQNKHIETNA